MAYEKLNLQDGQVLDAAALAHMEDGIEGAAAGALPAGAGAHQQLVTDGEGNTGWADRLAYEQTTTQVLCDVADAGENQSYDASMDAFRVENIPAIYPQGIIAGQSYAVEIGDETIQVVADSSNRLKFEWGDSYPPYNVTVTQNANTYTALEQGGVGGQFLEGYSFKITGNVTNLKQIDPKFLPVQPNVLLYSNDEGKLYYDNSFSKATTKVGILNDSSKSGVLPLVISGQMMYAITSAKMENNGLVLSTAYDQSGNAASLVFYSADFVAGQD